MSGVVMITGGSRGIGAATARRAAGLGYRLCINYATNAAAAQALVGELKDAGAEAIALQADVADEGQVAAMFREMDNAFGPVTALVNNAGIAGHVDRLDEASAGTIRQVIDTNVLGTIWCAREAVRRMSIRRGGIGGAIVNLSSGAATLGSPNQYVWYAASKGAVDSFTAGLGREVAGEGIRVNAAAPGFVKTEIHAASGMHDRIERDAPSVPIGRAAEAAEIAEAILWLLSDAASYVTGTVLRVAGGR